MNIDAVVDIESFDTEITTIIADDNVIAYSSPLNRRIKLLVEISIEAERLISDDAAKR